MINSNMKTYNYYQFNGRNDYGEDILSSSPIGVIKLSIHITSQSTQNNINYQNCNYVGFTHDTKVDDTYVIEFEGAKLKVMYVNPVGRFKQVFMVKL